MDQILGEIRLVSATDQPKEKPEVHYTQTRHLECRFQPYSSTGESPTAQVAQAVKILAGYPSWPTPKVSRLRSFTHWPMSNIIAFPNWTMPLTGSWSMTITRAYTNWTVVDPVRARWRRCSWRRCAWWGPSRW